MTSTYKLGPFPVTDSTVSISSDSERIHFTIPVDLDDKISKILRENMHDLMEHTTHKSNTYFQICTDEITLPSVSKN